MGLLAIFRPKRKDLADQIVGGALAAGTAPVRGEVSPFERFQVRSLVAAGMEINGSLVSQKGAAIDGIVNGAVEVRGANTALLIRQGARVNGPVRTPMALIRGEVNGDIDARFVRLYPGSRVNGCIRSERLVVDDGATITNDAIGVRGVPTLEDDSPKTVELTQAEGRARLVPRLITRDERMREILDAAQSYSGAVNQEAY